MSSTSPDALAGKLAETAPLPPPRVPDHELLKRIGRGAYGEVWLALSVTGAFRAVKIVHRQTFDHDRPFEREFEGILRFEPISRRHESQVDILHVGRGDDCFYYVMELADDQVTGGQIHPEDYTPRTLKSEVLFRTRLPFEECVRIGLSLATALENLHGNGLVHRDVKPSNIIFVNGVPKLADIGLVAGVEATRSYVGTEGFAAPEGSGSPQADLYSLGKVLYEISTGKDRQEFPELPTQLRELPDREGLMELNAVIARACRHNPEDRYATATAMRADLEVLQSGKSLARLHRVEKQLRWVRRASVLVTVLAALIATGWLWQAQQTGIVRRLATEKAALAEEKDRLAEENRQRLVRLDIANGVRLMDADDFSGALLWFVEALPLLTNHPAEETIHRIRIQQVLDQSPRLLQVLPHEMTVTSGAFSPDGQRVATSTATGDLRIWDAESGTIRVGPLLGMRIEDLRFTKEGTRLLASTSDDRRGPNHRGVLKGSAVVLKAASGHPVFPAISDVRKSAFSPDARLLAVARPNFAIEVIDATNGRGVVQLNGHSNEITMLNFSADGGLLASASRDQTVRLWRLPSGEPLGLPLRHDQAVIRALFSPDARRLATATQAPSGEKYGSIRTWAVATGQEIGSAIPATGDVVALDFDPTNSRRLITSDNDPWITVRDAGSHMALLPPLKFEGASAWCWAFSPDGLRLAAGSDDGTARVWDLETGEPVTPSLRHGGWVESVSFSPDGRYLLTTSDDATAKIWDLGGQPEPVRALRLDVGIVSELEKTRISLNTLSRDGQRLLLFAKDGTLRLVNLQTFTQQGAPLPSPDTEIAGAMTFDANGHQWAAALGPYKEEGRARNVSLWRDEGGDRRHLELKHPQAVRGIQFNADGSRLQTWSDDSRLRTWDTVHGKLLEERESPVIYKWMAAWSPVASRSLVLREPIRPDQEAPAELLDLSKPGAVGIPLAASAVMGMNMAAFSPDGNLLATVGDDQCGHIWNVRTGQELVPPFKHGGSLFWVEWSPDGRRVLTAGLATKVKVWSVATGKPARESMELAIEGHLFAHFSPDGRFVVARGDDKFVRVWDSVTAEALTPRLKHAGEVRAAMITKDNRLVTVSEPGVIRAWDLSPTSMPAGVIADYARLLAGRTLDRSGVMHSLKPNELAQLRQSLAAKAPALFTTDPQNLREWHRRQVLRLSNLAQVRAASFHLDSLAKLGPLDAEMLEARAKVQARQIPSRDSATAANLVNLTDAYTHSFRMLPNQDFADLPTGVQTLGGIRFDVRGLIRLEQADLESSVELGHLRIPEVQGIQIGRRCLVLHFLQGVDGNQSKNGDEVARWRIHYTDGAVQDWPVLFGETTSDWWYHNGSDPATDRPVRPAVVAWEGHPPIPLRMGADSVRLWRATWTNPRPEIEVSHLDFVIGKTKVCPFVVAITTE